MNAETAFGWLAQNLDVSRETFAILERYLLLIEAAQRYQNLISASTLPEFWTRHVIDSAQLVTLASKPARHIWLDVGSGVGVPGIVTAIVTAAPTFLVESRARRAEFLREVVRSLELKNVQVIGLPIEKANVGPVGIIMARAVAPLPKLLRMTYHSSAPDTIWLLPKGKSAVAELASLDDTWQGDWELHDSVTDAHSKILVGRHVRMGSKA